MEVAMKMRKISHSKPIRSSLSSTRVVKPIKKKPYIKLRKCVCPLTEYGMIEFPAVWNEFRIHEQLCDGIIHSNDGKTMNIHRVLLSAVSPYFKTLFINSLNGGKPENKEVNVDIKGHILELILDYAYTGQCNVSSHNVEELLPIADQYEVLGVVRQCCHYLLEKLQPENCLGIFKFARNYFCHDLEERGRRYIRHNFKKILHQSSEFKELSAEELETILRDDELNVRNEETVFEAIMKWTEADLPNRKKYLKILIHCARYGLMSFKFFTDVVMNNKLIRENPELHDSLYPASLFLAHLDSKQEPELDLNDPIARPRIPYEILFAIGGWSAGSPTNFVETYDTRADRWYLSVNTDFTPRAYHGMCVLDNLIYMIGGFDGNEHFNTVRCYNPITREWKEQACMYNSRCYVSVCTLGGKIYALGGYNGRTRMSSGERYTPSDNQWEVIPSMQCQRSDASAAALNNKIYIVGGFNGQEVLSSAEMFDPETNQWSYIYSMKSARSGVSLVAYRNCLYALGGFNGLTRLNT
ncbi:hypothetical protein L9F63_022143, partial [Diploptera punctata]